MDLFGTLQSQRGGRKSRHVIIGTAAADSKVGPVGDWLHPQHWPVFHLTAGPISRCCASRTDLLLERSINT